MATQPGVYPGSQGPYGGKPIMPGVPGPYGGKAKIHLLNGLVSYWKLDSNAGTDSQDSNTLSETAGVTHPAGGIISNYCSVSGTGVGTYLLATPANMQLGVGKSFTFQVWVKYGADTVPIAAQSYAGSPLVWRLYLGVRNIHWLCYDQSGGVSDWDTGLVLPTTGWHHILCGYDASVTKQFCSLDGGSRLTNAMASDLRASSGIFVIGADGTAITDNVGVDESGFWNRVLNLSELAALYNAGAGLPYSSFTS